MSRTYEYAFSDPLNTDIVITTADDAQVYTDYDGNKYIGYYVTGVSGFYKGQAITGLLGDGGYPQTAQDTGNYDNTIFIDNSQGSKGSSFDGIDVEGIGFVTSTDRISLFTRGDSFRFMSNMVEETATLQSYNPPCYVAGTLIRTLRGDVAVQDLTANDIVVTFSGAHRPIRWLGHRVIDCRTHHAPETVIPVRISAGSFGPSRPARDLFVSPGHALCVDVPGKMLIPAGVLVNSTTIQQVKVDTVTYWHVELDSHDILLAENMPAESYLDMGNRRFFNEAGVVDLAAAPDADLAQRTHADFCHPFVAAGPIVDLVRSRLRERAVAAGWRLAEGSMSDVHIVADGRIVRPDIEGLSARFVLPADALDVRLVSEVGVPSHLGPGEDNRCLGLCVKGVTIDDGLALRRDVAIKDVDLCVGFHGCEDGVRRWTAGRARLPASLWDGCRGQFFLRVDLEREPLSKWVAPIKEGETKQGADIVPLRNAR